MPKKNLLQSTLGFTLIELLISIVIVVILSSIGIASFNSANARNGVQQRAAEIRSLARKLRTDAGAAIKPSSCVTGNATVSGTFISFTSGPGGAYSYGVACFESDGTTNHNSVINSNLPTGFTFDSSVTIIFPFNGLAGSQASPPTQASDFLSAAMASPQAVKITDGSQDFYIYFNNNGLICEQKTTTPPICAS